MRKTNLNKFILLIFILSALQLASSSSLAQSEPKIEGSPFKEINYESKPVSEEEKTQIEKNAKKGSAPAIAVKGPKRRTRGDDKLDGGGRTIFQFTNWDFPVTGNTCGQAAVATAMWNKGLKEVWNKNAPDFARSIYNYAPPKITVPNIGSNDIGTDWRQVSYALDGYKKYGIQYGWFKGKALLDKYIDMELPCIIMLDMGVFGRNLWGVGHWVVAFARDANGYYITNWDKKYNGQTKYISWSELNRAWGGVLTEGQLAKVHGTAGMFCVVWK